MKSENIIRGNWYSDFVFNFPDSIKMGENRMYVIIEMRRKIRNNRIGAPWNATPNPQLFPLMSSLGEETHSSFEFGNCPESGSASRSLTFSAPAQQSSVVRTTGISPGDHRVRTRGRYAKVYTLDDALSRISSREEKESETKMGTHSWAPDAHKSWPSCLW